MPGKPSQAGSLKKVAAGDRILASDQNALRGLATRSIDIPDAIQDSTGIRVARSRRRGGGGAASIRFEIIAPGPYLGDLEIECDYVVAEVVGVSCQSAGVQVGDEINVWDPDNCHFNLPIELLYGVRGRAIQMANDLDGVIDCYDIRAQDGSCRWEVIGLCCTEEIYGNT